MSQLQLYEWWSITNGSTPLFLCNNHNVSIYLIEHRAYSIPLATVNAVLCCYLYVVYLRSTPHPVTVTNEGLQGFPTKNGITLVVTVIGWGVDLTYILQTSPSNLHFTSVCVPPASPRWRWWTSARTPPCEKTWPRCCQRRTILVVALQTAGVVIINAAEGFHTQKDTFFWYCIFSTRLERYN